MICSGELVSPVECASLGALVHSGEETFAVTGIDISIVHVSLPRRVAERYFFGESNQLRLLCENADDKVISPVFACQLGACCTIDNFSTSPRFPCASRPNMYTDLVIFDG